MILVFGILILASIAAMAAAFHSIGALDRSVQNLETRLKALEAEDAQIKAAKGEQK